MRVAVIVPTTEGPAAILRLTPLAKAPRSVMRTQDDYHPLPPSSRYHDFIQTGGGLAERIGLHSGQFELRLGAKVETGRSWELPVALAHWLHAGGHRLDSENADLVIWATGALDNDLLILAQDYHLPTKLALSTQLIQGWLDRGVQTLVLVPEQISPPRELLDRQLAIHKVTDFATATVAIGKALSRGRDGGPVVSLDSPHSRLRFLPSVVALLFLVGLLWFLVSSRTPTASTQNQAPLELERTDNTLSDYEANGGNVAADARLEALDRASEDSQSAPPREGVVSAALSEQATISTRSAIPLLVLEQAPEGVSCRQVLFASETAQRIELEVSDGVFGSRLSGELCALGFKLPETVRDPVDITFAISLIELILPSDRRESVTLRPGIVRLFRLRADLPARIETELGLVAPETGRSTLRLVLQAAP